MHDVLISGLTETYGTRKSHKEADRRIADAIRSSLFPKQKAVLLDEAKRKAVLCPRRAGKSWTALSYIFDTALRKPNSNSVIVTLTLKTAKGIYWKALQEFANRFGIEVDYNHTELRVTLKNGSQFFLIGAESRSEVEKFRGQAYDLVVIDECKSYPAGILEELITDAVGPALKDRGGTLMMIGTPGMTLDGLFYKATYPGILDNRGIPYSRSYDTPEEYWKHHKRYRWSRHSWTMKENDRTPENLWDAALLEKEDNNWDDDHPTWQREYLGQWVSEAECYVYAYATLRQTAPDKVHWIPERSRDNPAGLPEHASSDWRFVLGADLGYEDDFAVVVAAYSPYREALYHVLDYKANHQDFYQVVDVLQALWDRFGGFDAMVGDAAGLGKLVVETIAKRHGLPMQAAEKREKFDHIELLNADIHAGKVKIIEGSDLALELAALQFDLRKGSKKDLARMGKLREDPGLPNHLTDSLLYAWRFSNHYWSAPKRKQYAPGSPDAVALAEEEWMQRLVKGRDNPSSLWQELRERSFDPLSQHYKLPYDFN